MIGIDIRMDRLDLAGLGEGSAELFKRRQMEVLGQFALRTVIARTKQGLGSNDQAMPALSRKSSPVLKHGKFVRQRVGYAEWKAKHGLRPIRDMVGTGKVGGHMLDNPSVRQVTDSSVRIAITSRSARAKAISNEKRTPFFSFSDSDQKKIMDRAAEIFTAEVQALARQIRPGAKTWTAA
jgi:hypothetical protein